MKLLQINSVLNNGSTGRIMEGIGKVAKETGYESYAAYSILGSEGTSLKGIPIGTNIDKYLHGLKSRALDRHGFGSRHATEVFIEQIREIDPDVIGLHNLHGYYLNIDVLFKFLKETQKPVVWTFHDCWPFTGHCSYFDRVDCKKWKTECHHCPMKTYYPASYGLDQSNKNFHDKKKLFTGLKNLTIITPSHWLKELVKQSFLKEYQIEVIHNGIDLQVFKPVTKRLPGHLNGLEKKIILGVASTWDDRKGLDDFLKLSKRLSEDYVIVLVGLSESQLKTIPKNILGLARTANVDELAALYSEADVYLNPTYSDNFPTTNIEALACGTPVVTYNTGGSPEAINKDTGAVVEKRDIEGLKNACIKISNSKGDKLSRICRERALKYFNEKDRFQEYMKIYNKREA